jgi:hypothetical protein
MFGLFGGPSKQDILNEGRQAMALVRDVQDTGTRVNNRPRIALTLEVQPMGQPSWTVEKKLLLSNDDEYPHVGQQIPVRFLPEDHDRVEIDRGAMEMSQAQIVTDSGSVPASAPMRAPEPPPPPAAPPVPPVPTTPEVGDDFGSLQDAIAAAQASGNVQWVQGGAVIDARGNADLRKVMTDTLAQYGISMPDAPAPQGATTPIRFSAGSSLSPATPQSSTGANPPDDDPVAKLEKLAELKKDGVLTDAEFAAAKAKLLGEI